MAVEKIISRDILVIPQGGNGIALQLKNNPISVVNVEREERIENTHALSTAIAVVSNELSNEISVRAAADVAIENHVSEVSAAVVSVNAYLSGISARSVGNISTHGLQSVVDALSNRISAAVAGASVTSQELSAGLAAVSAQAASAVNVVSAAVVDEASIRSVAINTVSNAASNALSAANAASVAVNVVSNALSAEIIDRISADNVLSAAIDVVSNALSNEISVRTAASAALEIHADAASAAATSVNSRVTSVNSFLSGISARSVGDVSTHGIQSVIDALSNRISAGAGGSVTSAELSAVSANAASAYVPKFLSLQNVYTSSLAKGTPVYAFTSAETVHPIIASVAGATSIQHQWNLIGVVADDSIAVSAVGLIQTQGVINFTSSQVSNLVSGGGSSFSIGNPYYVANLQAGRIQTSAPTGVETALVRVGVALNVHQLLILPNSPDFTQNRLSTLSVLQNFNSAKISALSDRISANSVALTSVDGRVTSVNTIISNVSVKSVGGTSVKGLQSVLDALSNRISAGGGTASVTSQELSVVAAGLSSRIDTASALATTADVHASTASAAATSVDGRVNSVNTFLSGISARSVGGVSTHGIQSVVDALSGRIAAIPGGGSANPYSYVSAGQAICANAFTDISGLCVSVSAGGIYELRGQVMFSCSAATGNSFTLVFPTMSAAAGQLRAPFLNPVPGTSVGYSAITWGNFGTAGSGSALISSNFAAGALFDLIIDGVLNVNTTGVVKVQARGSVATNTITIVPGSYLKVFKIR